LVGKPEGRDHLKYLDIDGRVILKSSKKNRVGRCGLYHLAQDRDWWWTLVNTVMNIQVK
jgi:hypothetical protein